ncbi:MAG: 1-deoxypentalenic acid 11-beta-hydroxylase [Pseudomonadota bacterium]|jgi:ectoine hydroxylase-related dioxygenase (phytanoyl-CoA dioxygenase family)
MKESMSKQQGSAALRNHYERDGYVVVPGIFSRDLLTSLRGYTEEMLAASNQRLVQTAFDAGGAVKLVKVSGLAERDARYRELATAPALVDVVEALLGPEARRFRDVLVVKPARTGGAFSYHQDSAYWDVEPKALLSCWIALGDVSQEASCLRVVPQSHEELVEHGLYFGGKKPVPRPIVRGLRRLVSLAGTGDNPDQAAGSMLAWRLKQLILARATRVAPFVFDLQDYRIPPAMTVNRREVELPVRAGDVIFFHSLLWHASGPNRTEASRYAEIISFMGANARIEGRSTATFPAARAHDVG